MDFHQSRIKNGMSQARKSYESLNLEISNVQYTIKKNHWSKQCVNEQIIKPTKKKTRVYFLFCLKGITTAFVSISKYFIS